MSPRITAVLAAAVIVMAMLVPAAAAETVVQTQPDWAPVAQATIRPGVQITSQSGGCTSNFIFYRPVVDEAGATSFDIFIGLAAHCFSLGTATQTNACTTPTRPLGSTATIRGASKPGVLAYSSWVTTKEVRETDANVCAINDFALVKIDPADHAKVNPTVQYFGGPTGLRATPTALGDKLYSYGNSSLRQGIAQLSPKRGVSTGMTNAGWSHRVYTMSPGVPGDSGSGMLDDQGRAMGVVVTLAAAPFPASNGVTDMAKALAYANDKTGMNLSLALGTQPFGDRVLP